MKKIERIPFMNLLHGNYCDVRKDSVVVKETDLDELEQQRELLKGKNKALQNVVDNYYTNNSISMINDLREKLSIVARQRDELLTLLIEMYDDWKYIDYYADCVKEMIEKIASKTWEQIKAGKRKSKSLKRQAEN